jgi:DNA replication protein DnaC
VRRLVKGRISQTARGLLTEPFNMRPQLPTLGDAILDRIVHAAYKIDLAGESMRNPKARQDES